ncbi:hypothetical protein KDA_58920 [Dictyobacter alpinus]|uniref:histidine kinase n=1 Tax=Dictyobacter alpinus TaxID=2014873 RepID=A0A402BG69_9CHLR|nr:HAMP domain-containing sensor histidine kinase [Dictyobacter alpinus]GCE30408.1 hypothetical protein KDA_58920 [Dictyobacter alpinus]
MNHILLLLDHKTNRTLLSDWLGQHYQVLSPEQGTIPAAPFDLCLIDGPALDRLWKEIRQRKTMEDPAFLPVVLITSNREAELLTRHLWKTVDELIRVPIEKLELQARVEMLLRTRQLSQDLKLRNEDLESFFHAMTHDLRAPLRAIKSFTQLLQEEEGAHIGEQGQQDLLQIHSASAQMEEIIGGLVAFARVERSNRQMQSVSLASLVETCLRRLQPDIQQRQAQIVLDGRLPDVQGNNTLLSLTLTNLLSNALKFMPPGERPVIAIRASTSQQICRLEIEDNGIGISSEDQQRLFQPFVQLHGVEVYEGVGLGLATVRKAVDLMGGRIGVTSTPGKGSIFWIELHGGA